MRIPNVIEDTARTEPCDTDTFLVVSPRSARQADDEQEHPAPDELRTTSG